MKNLNEQKFLKCIEEYQSITNQLKEESKYTSKIPQDNAFYNVCGYYIYSLNIKMRLQVLLKGTIKIPSIILIFIKC